MKAETFWKKYFTSRKVLIGHFVLLIGLIIYWVMDHLIKGV